MKLIRSWLGHVRSWLDCAVFDVIKYKNLTKLKPKKKKKNNKKKKKKKINKTSTLFKFLSCYFEGTISGLWLGAGITCSYFLCCSNSSPSLNTRGHLVVNSGICSSLACSSTPHPSIHPPILIEQSHTSTNSHLPHTHCMHVMLNQTFKHWTFRQIQGCAECGNSWIYCLACWNTFCRMQLKYFFKYKMCFCFSPVKRGALNFFKLIRNSR